MRNELLKNLVRGSALIGLVIDGCAPAAPTNINPPEKPQVGPTPTLSVPGKSVTTGNFDEGYSVYHSPETNRFLVISGFLSGIAKAENDISQRCGVIARRSLSERSSFPLGGFTEAIDTENPC